MCVCVCEREKLVDNHAWGENTGLDTHCISFVSPLVDLVLTLPAPIMRFMDKHRKSTRDQRTLILPFLPTNACICTYVCIVIKHFSILLAKN